MALREMSTEEFLAYEARSKGSFLGAEWKKQGWLQAWLHRKLPYATGWQHGIPRIDVKDDENRNPKRSIFTGSYRCIEDEDVVKEQTYRDKDTNERKKPPRICPPCLLIEHVHMMVIRGELHWLEPVFDFDIGVAEKRVLIRASGMWNGYGSKKLTDDQKGEMEDAGVYAKNDWNQNLQAALKYIFCVVDDAAPGKGVQIMKEGQGLGDKVKVAIQKEMKRNPRNPRLGDPVQNPYAFQFEYKQDALPADKYDAFRVDLEITEQIQKLIDGPKPNIDMMAGDYQMNTLRAQLERACLIDGLPWDEWFTPEAEAILSKEDEAEEPRKAPTRAAPAAPTNARAPAPRAPAPNPGRPDPRSARPAAPPPRAPAAPPVDMFGCDDCGKPIAATDATCPHCGKEYEVQQAEPPEPAPLPPLRKRSEVGKAQAASRGVPATRGQMVVPARAAVPAAAPRRSEAAANLEQKGREAGRREVARGTDATRSTKEGEVVERGTDEPVKTLVEEQDDIGFGDFGDDQIPF